MVNNKIKNQQTIECPERAIQKAVEDYIKINKLINYRIPDSFFRWIAVNAPPNIKKWFFGLFGGKEDNTIIYPLGNGYGLALLMELKTQTIDGKPVGKTHGKQKLNETNWIICRDINTAIKEIDRFIRKAKEIKKNIK